MFRDAFDGVVDAAGSPRLLRALGLRFRDVRAGPDGAVWLLTDETAGDLLRVTPAGGRLGGG